MTIHAVNSTLAGECETLALFSTRRKAEDFIAAREAAQSWSKGDMEIAEFTLDEPDPMWLTADSPLPLPGIRIVPDIPKDIAR